MANMADQVTDWDGGEGSSGFIDDADYLYVEGDGSDSVVAAAGEEGTWTFEGNDGGSHNVYYNAAGHVLLFVDWDVNAASLTGVT